MKTNKDYVLRKIADEIMLVPTGEAAQHINGLIRLTSTAAFIYSQVDACETLEEIVSKVVEEYDVDEETAKKDLFGMLCEFQMLGFVSGIKEFENGYGK